MIMLCEFSVGLARGEGVFPSRCKPGEGNNHYSASYMLNSGERHEASDEGSGIDCAALAGCNSDSASRKLRSGLCSFAVDMFVYTDCPTR
jgi:hypothetical protein